MNVIVIANKKIKMENLDEIENLYEIKVEKEDKNFIKKLNNCFDKEEKRKLEREFRIKLRRLIEEYNKDVFNFLNKKGVVLFEKNEEISNRKVKKQKIPKYFQVKPFNLKLSYSDKFKIWWNLFKFNFKINLRNFFHKFLPSRTFFYLIKTKHMFVNLYIDFKLPVVGFFNKLYEKIKYFLIKVKTTFIKIVKNVLKFLKSTFAKIFAFKKEKKKTKDKKTNVFC